MKFVRAEHIRRRAEFKKIYERGMRVHSRYATVFMLPNEGGIIENDWAMHQLQTTANFARKSKLISWYVGGLNFQVEHHLFPYISHIHYPQIAEIVKETAQEYGVPYIENRTLFCAVSSHFAFLYQLGKPVKA